RKSPEPFESDALHHLGRPGHKPCDDVESAANAEHRRNLQESALLFAPNFLEGGRHANEQEIRATVANLTRHLRVFGHREIAVPGPDDGYSRILLTDYGDK